MSNRLGDELIYKTVSQYAKSKGMTFTVGNPGVDTKPTFVGTTDACDLRRLGLPGDDLALRLAHQLSEVGLRLLVLRRPAPNHALVKEARKPTSATST